MVRVCSSAELRSFIQFIVYVQAAGDFPPLVAYDIPDCSPLRPVTLLFFIKRSLKWLILEKQWREFVQAAAPGQELMCGIGRYICGILDANLIEGVVI